MSAKDEESEKKEDLEEKLKNAEEKIEKLEEKSRKDEDRDFKLLLYKSEGTTLVLSIVLGLLGINGVGHLYVGKIGKGVWILIGSIVLFIIGIVTVYFGVGIVLLIIYFVVFIWQIIDSRKLCQEYNEHVRKTGSKPW